MKKRREGSAPEGKKSGKGDFSFGKLGTLLSHDNASPLVVEKWKGSEVQPRTLGSGIGLLFDAH